MNIRIHIYTGGIFLINRKKLPIYLFVFFLGIIAGAVYMSFSDGENEMLDYLSRCFESFSDTNNKFKIFKNSLFDNIKLLIVIFACSFFKFGWVGTYLCCLFKGFSNGFTTAAFVKYYGIRGLLVPVSSIFSTIVFLPAFIALCLYSAAFFNYKKDKSMLGKFLFFQLLCLAVFCAVSFFDGYVTTTFIKILKPFICQISS